MTNPKTKQAVIWLKTPLAFNGGVDLRVLAADIAGNDDTNAFVVMNGGTLTVGYSAIYMSNDGNVDGAVAMVNEEGFIDARVIPEA